MAKSKKSQIQKHQKTANAPIPRKPAPQQLLDDVEMPTHGILPSPMDELRAMPTAISELGGSYRGKLNSVLARLYEIALRLRSEPDLWQDFCRLPEWENFKGKKPDIDSLPDALRSCIRFAVGFNNDNATKTASKYFSALSVPFEQQVPSSDVAEYIENHGGIEELAKRNAKLRREGNVGLNDNTGFSIFVPPEIAKALGTMTPDKPFKATLKSTDPDARGVRQIEILQVKSKD